MALTYEELKFWNSTKPTSKEWHNLRIMSRIDGAEKLKKGNWKSDNRI